MAGNVAPSSATPSSGRRCSANRAGSSASRSSWSGPSLNGASNGNGNGHGHAPDHAASPGDLLLKGRVEALERDLVQQALQASGGSRREAADLLGVSLRDAVYKLRRYRLE